VTCLSHSWSQRKRPFCVCPPQRRQPANRFSDCSLRRDYRVVQGPSFSEPAGPSASKTSARRRRAASPSAAAGELRHSGCRRFMGEELGPGGTASIANCAPVRFSRCAASERPLNTGRGRPNSLKCTDKAYDEEYPVPRLEPPFPIRRRPRREEAHRRRRHKPSEEVKARCPNSQRRPSEPRLRNARTNALGERRAWRDLLFCALEGVMLRKQHSGAEEAFRPPNGTVAWAG
jgi:hypothetical protein